jgi:hypothetical protein
MSTYVPYSPHVPVRQFRGESGNEPNGMRLPWSVLDSLAETQSRHLPDEFVVIGEWQDDDKSRLDFGVTTAYIEATTRVRYDPDNHRLRSRCPLCAAWDGKHLKGCLA